MYKYKDVAFRIIEQSDLQTLRELHNDSSTFLNLGSIHLVDEIDQQEWWEKLHTKSNDIRYVICLADNPSVVIGRIRIISINRENQNCEIGLDISSEYRGKGYGNKSYVMLLEFLFLHFNMNMVYLRVAEFNEAAITLYEKVGFEHTGFIKEDLYRHGKYWNHIIMCILKSEYNAKYKKR